MLCPSGQRTPARCGLCTRTKKPSKQLQAEAAADQKEGENVCARTVQAHANNTSGQ